MERNEFEYRDWLLQPVDDFLDIRHFDCGDEDMNRYFRKKSRQYSKHLLVKRYHFCPKEYKESEPIVLVDLCNDCICRKYLPEESINRIHTQKRFLETFPAVKIARLGRNIRFKGYGVSVHLFNALKTFFTQENRTGCRFLTLDAYPKRVGLYESCGFTRTLPEDDGRETRTVSMFFDLLPYEYKNQ